MKKIKYGISLIVLLIAIIVVVIISSVVILNVTKNNPMDSSKIVKLLQEKESLESSTTAYIAKVRAKTLGKYSMKDILTGKVDGYTSIVTANEIEISGAKLYEVDKNKVKESMNVNLPKTSNEENVKWYINVTNGKYYLVHEEVSDYAKYLGEYDETTERLKNEALSGFVITKKETTEVAKIIADGSFNGKVNTPVLMEGMSGIYFDESGNEVIVTAENQANWYDYDTQKWANAKTEDGSYWVWIPRYEYKITGETINVKFIPTEKTDVDSGYSYIHPAFRDGRKSNYMNGEWDEEIPGFWVAKYAAGFQASTTSETDATVLINGEDTVVYSDKNYTSSSTTCETNALLQTLTSLPKISYPVFKPLTYAYNNISVEDIYVISQEIAKASSFYGLNESSTDSHMMKNSEWGAVAYLTQSSYGRNGVEITENAKNLDNLNSKYIYAVTGYGKKLANDLTASSTGNKSGVFDLRGCLWEMISGYISNGSLNILNYGATYASKVKNPNGYLTLSTKYTTVYPYDSSDDSSLQNWIEYDTLKSATYGYGDAILETSTSGSGFSSWNSDQSMYMNSVLPFLGRGGDNSGTIYSGTFAFKCTHGGARSGYGFRAVLVSRVAL